jgi:hypothetical protein
MFHFSFSLLKTAFQGIHSLSKLRLSKREKEILYATQERGELWLLHWDGGGTWLRSGKSDFIDPKDRALQEEYLEAFISLRKRGFIRQVSTTYFGLTGSGFKKARSLKDIPVWSRAAS